MAFQGRFGKTAGAPAAGQPQKNFVLPKKSRKGPILLKKNEAAIAEHLDSLKKQPKFGKMVVYSVGCFEKLAVDETSCEELLESGAIEQMLLILQANPENEAIHAAVNRYLKSIAKNERLAAMLAARIQKARGWGAYANALENHVEIETLTAACGVLGVINKVAVPENVNMMVQAGIPQALCNVVVKHGSKNMKVMEAAVEAIARFGLEGKVAPEIVRSGAIEAILTAMREHPENLILVKSAAALIAGLCKSGGPEVIEALKKMGAVDCLVSALDAHPYDGDLVAYGSEALKHLTGAHDMGIALAPVIQGDVRMDAKLAASLARIAALALVDENIAYMQKNHGPDWLMSILKNAAPEHGPIFSKILANGLRVLQKAMSDESKIYDIMKKGGVPLLTSILHGHMGDEKVVEGALTALAKMVTRKENAVYIGNKGGIEMAMKAVATHPKSAIIARSALDLFSCMASFPETGNMMIEKGALKTIMDILDNHIDQPDVCLASIQALGKLATSEENVTKMIDAGMLPRLVNVLKRHPDNAELCNNTMMAMDTAMLIPGTAGKLKRLGAADAIADVIDRHTDEPEIQEIGQRLHDVLTGEDEKRKAEEEAKRKLAEEEQMKMVEAERVKAMEAEAARLKARQAEQENLLRIQRQKDEAERMAQLARLEEERAKQLEQQALEAEMAAALEAMRASEQAARLRAIQAEEAKKKQEEKARLAAEMEAVKAKQAEDQKRLDEIDRQRKELEKMRLELSKKDDSGSEHQVYNLMPMRPDDPDKAKPKGPKLKKSARELFDPDEEKEKKPAVLPPPIRSFLQAGQLLTKHSKTAPPRPRHLYLSADCEWLLWKDSHQHEIDPKQRMRIYKIYGVGQGRVTPQLQRKRFGKYLAKEECCFSIHGADIYETERTLDLEAPSAKECQAWVHAVEVLIEYAKNKMLYGQLTVNMRSDKELRQLGHKKDKGDDDDDDAGVVYAAQS